jgi:uncharacterized protein
MTAAPLLGRLLWYELKTTDQSAAKAFYTTVVGWTVTSWDGDGTQYSMWTRAPQVPVGGVLTLPDALKAHGVPPHWMMFVGVPSMEDAASHIEQLGGGALSPVMQVPTIGRMQTMQDAQGAAFSICEPATAPAQPDAPPECGDVSWIELITTDAGAAMLFYRELFGWQATEAMDMGELGTYQMFGRELGSMGGMRNRPPSMAQVPPNWLLYFRVSDAAEAAHRVRTNGGQVLNGPMEVPGGDWIVQCTDPQGAAFALHQKRE